MIPDEFNELRAYAQMAQEKGDLWVRLEKTDAGCLMKCLRVYSDGRREHYNSPVYQVFTAEGKRVYSSSSYPSALSVYEEMVRDGTTRF